MNCVFESFDRPSSELYLDRANLLFGHISLPLPIAGLVCEYGATFTICFTEHRTGSEIVYALTIPEGLDAIRPPDFIYLRPEIHSNIKIPILASCGPFVVNACSARGVNFDLLSNGWRRRFSDVNTEMFPLPDRLQTLPQEAIAKYQDKAVRIHSAYRIKATLHIHETNF